MALPVNFKDDVLASSMDGKRRYNMITNSDGTVSFEDVTTYSQEGSNFGSAQINNTNGEINKINNNVLDTIEEISANTSGGKFAGALALKNVNNSLVANSKHFYFDYKNGKYGYNTNPNRGADTFFPFKSGVNFGLISKQYKTGLSTHTIDVTGILKLYYSSGIGANSYIKLNVNGNTINLSSDNQYVFNSAFAKEIVNGITLKHYIDVSAVDSITVTAYSYTSANQQCDLIFSSDETIKLESDYLLYV